MKKLLKFAFVLLGGLVLLVVAAGIVLRVWFPPEKIRGLIVERAERALGREIEVGDVSLGLVRGIRISDVKISEKPDFKAGTFLETQELSLRPSLRPLLQGRLVVDQVRLRGFHLEVEQRPDGKFNFSDLAGPPSAPQPVSEPARAPAAERPAQTGSKGMPLALDISKAVIEDGELKYEAPGVSAQLHVGEAGVKDFKLAGPFAWNLSSTFKAAQGQKTAAGLVEAQGTADLAGPDPSKLALGVESARVEVGSITVSLKGELHGPSSGKIEADIGPFKSEDLEAFSAVPPGMEFPSAKLEAEFAASAKGYELNPVRFALAGLEADGAVSIEGTAVSLKLKSNEFDIKPLAAIHPAGRSAGLSGNAAFEFDVAYRGDRLNIASFELSAGPVKLSAGGSVLLEKEPSASLNLSTNLFSLEKAAALVAGLDVYKPSGQAKLEATLGGTLTKPTARGLLTLASAGAAYKTLKLDGFSTTASFTQDSVQVPRLTGKLNGSDLDVQFSGRLGQQPEFKLSGNLSALDAGALSALVAPSPASAAPASSKSGSQAQPRAPAPSLPPIRTSGTFSIGAIRHPNLEAGKTDLRWSLSGITPDLKSIDGSASLQIGPGRAVNVLSLLKTTVGRALFAPVVVLQQARGLPGLNVPDLDEIPFTSVIGEYAFKKGVMNMHPFALQGPALSFRTEGDVDLKAQTVNLKVAMQEGEAKPKLLVKGPMAKPSVTPDLSAMGQEGLSQAAGALQKQGEQLIRGLFK